MMVTNRDRGAAIRAARKAKALTQYAVAEAAGVSEGTVRNLEKGAGTPHRANLEAVCKVLGLDPATVGTETYDPVRPLLSPDVRVFLDVFGGALMRMTEAEREATIADVWARHIMHRD